MAAGAVAVALVMGAGCGKVAEKATEKAAEQAIEADGSCTDVDLDLDSEGGGVSANCDGQDVDIDAGGGASLPDGFPADLAPPEGTEIVFSSGSDGGFTLTGSIEGEIDAIYDDIKAQVEAAGYTIDNEADSSAGGTNTRNLAATGPEYSINITVSNVENALDGLTLNYVVSPVSG